MSTTIPALLHQARAVERHPDPAILRTLAEATADVAAQIGEIQSVVRDLVATVGELPPDQVPAAIGRRAHHIITALSVLEGIHAPAPLGPPSPATAPPTAE